MIVPDHPSNFKTPSHEISHQELRKRRHERIAIGILLFVFLGLFVSEVNLIRMSTRLPLVNSIFFFGLLNINVLILVAIIWLIFRNIGKLFFERRSKILGSRLKTKLVIAFLAFSITPTVILFIISSSYINSSFDKWFSIKIQNTLQSSLDISQTFYRNSEENISHFAQHLSTLMSKYLSAHRKAEPNFFSVRPGERKKIEEFLIEQRDLLALSMIEFYPSPLEERILVKAPKSTENPDRYPPLALDSLLKAFGRQSLSLIQPISKGDLVRRVVPVYLENKRTVIGVLAAGSYIPISLVNKRDEIAGVFDDYKDTNPLKYPIKTAYFIILVMVTLVIIFVAIWMGLYLAREMTVRVEDLVHAAQEVGAGNLNVTVPPTGSDEISVLVEAFNKMTGDLKENQTKLTKATADLERRKSQLEAILTNIGTGVMVIQRDGTVVAINRAASQLLGKLSDQSMGSHYSTVLGKDAGPILNLVEQALNSPTRDSTQPLVAQWALKENSQHKTLAGIVTPLLEDQQTWGAVLVIDDLTYLVKAQREVAWREVARRIAHEIKNPLTPIKLSAQRLQRRFRNMEGEEAEVLHTCTDTIVKHTDELKEMVNEFSNFARLPQANPSPNSMSEVIEEVSALFSHAHPEIEFEIQLDPKMPIFEFDRDQIKRVLLNLLDNAIAALSLSDSKWIRISCRYQERLRIASIYVEDNGQGMTEDVRARVFEPYFSTKKDGTGLGLAIAKRIINDHDGFIRVQNRLPAGTQFVIELPTTPREQFVKRPVEQSLVRNETL